MEKLNSTTYKKIAIDNQKDLMEVVIGDDKDLSKFQPQTKIQRWNNEVNVSIRLKENPEELLEKPIIKEKDGKIEYKKSKRETNFYDIAPNEEYPDGASEFEVILKEKPDTNVVEFTIKDKDVDYFYQPFLTPEEVAQGVSRPENVECSYAVYAKTPKTNCIGGKEYKVGKIGHIFRPKIIDSAGTEVWGDLHIGNGILSVTIPQDFLDNAVYPIRHAAGLTFGYTSIGATYTNSNLVGYYRGSSFTSPASIDKVQSLTWYTYSAGNYNHKGVVYLTSTDGLVTNGVTDATASPSGSGWRTCSFSTPPSLSNSTAYILGVVVDTNSSQRFYNDTTGGTSYDDPGNSYSSPDATLAAYTTGTRKYSIYVTYTEPALGPANLKSYNTNLKANIKTINTNPIANVKTLNTNV